MSHTPGIFIPPLPGEGQSPQPAVQPPLVPSPRLGPIPSWLPPHQTPGMQHSTLPMYATPFYSAPVGLPPTGFAEDWVGFGPPTGIPPSAYAPHVALPGTPWYAPPQLAPAYPYPMAYGVPHPMYPPQMQTPGIPVGFIPPTPGSIDPNTADPMTGASTLARPKKEDQMFVDTRFMTGKHYGPVLDPLHMSAVHCVPRIHPLLSPAPDDPNDRLYLEWNMLFSSAFARRSIDASHISFSKGRDEPATFPRCLSMRLLSASFPWVVEIKALDPALGVTCGDVVDQLSNFLLSRVGQTEFNCSSKRVQTKIGETYHLNRSRAYGVPGGRMGEGLMRADWLGMDTMFDGIEHDADFVRRKLSLQSNRELPCIWVLRCAKRTSVSEDDARDQERRAENVGVQ